MPVQWLVIKKCEKIAYKEKMCTSIETGKNQVGSFLWIVSMLSWKKFGLQYETKLLYQPIVFEIKLRFLSLIYKY